MKRTFILIAGLFCLLLSTGSAKATIVTIGIEATVTSVSDDDNLLNGQITEGSSITGYYVYNTDVLDTNPLESVGDYWHNTSPYGIYLSCNEFVFATDQNNPFFLVEIGNNHGSTEGDFYLLRSYSNLNILDDVPVSHISWQLDDYSGNVVNDTLLTSAPPLLTAWPDTFAHLNIEIGSKEYGSISNIMAEVSSVYLIPEPASLTMILLGVMLAQKRFK